MALSQPLGFRIHIPEPIEVKMVSLTIKDRDAISVYERYKGLWTYVVEDDTFYYLSEGTANEHWKPINKPQAVEIYDQFHDKPQTIISGQGLKSYLQQHYYTKQELDSRLAGLEVSPWVKNITAQQIEKWDSYKSDISQRVDITDPKSTWVVQHPPGKSCEAFNEKGQKIVGRETRISDTITSFGWSKPLKGFVLIN